MILVNYLVMAAVGYLSFCDGVVDNVVDNLPTTAVPVLAARAALVLQLCCCLPLRFHVTAGAILRGEKERSASVSGGSGGVVHCAGCGTWRWIAVQTCLVSTSLLCACLLKQLHVVIGLTAAVFASCIIYIFPGLAYFNHMKLVNAAADAAAPAARGGGEEEGAAGAAAGAGDEGEDDAKGVWRTTMRAAVFPWLLVSLGCFVMVAGVAANLVEAFTGRAGPGRR